MINNESEFQKMIQTPDFDILITKNKLPIDKPEILNRPIMEFRKHLFNYIK